LDALVDEGHDLVHFWGELVGVVRDLMLLRAWPGGGDALSRSPEEAKALITAGGTLTLEDWTRVFQILAGLEFGLKASSQPRFLFEGALIRMAGLGAVRPIEEILATLGGTPTVPPAAKKTGEAKPTSPTGRSQPASRVEPAALRSPIAAGFEDVRAAVVSAVTQSRPMLGAMLERAVAVLVEGGTLVVTFGASDVGMRRVLMTDDNVRSIETIAAAALGRPLALRVAESSGDVAVGPLTPAVTTATSSLPSERTAAGGTEESRQALTERALKDPAVSRLLKEFGAQVVDVRPLRPDVEDAGTPQTVEENG
jgi:hypothetical protein